MRRLVELWCVLAVLGSAPGATSAAAAHAAAEPHYPTLPVNRWVPIEFRCQGGKPDYASGCPSSRGWVQLAYDSKRQRVVLFGGSGEWYFNDLWSFDWKSRVWHLIEQDSRLGGIQRDAAAYPAGRDNHQWVYDEVKDKFWLYGGTGGAGFWEWLPEARKWRLAQRQHDGNALPAAILDPGFAIAQDLRGILLFGGERYTFYDQTWWFDLDQERWQRLTPPLAPPARAQTENAMVYDTARKQFILFGGRAPSAKPLQDTWIFNPKTRQWREIKGGAAPPARDSHILVYDGRNDVVVAFGGAGRTTADTWLFNPKTERWSELVSARGDYHAPDSRVVSAVYIPEAELIFYRDLRGRVYFLRLDLAKDSQTAPAAPVHWKP